MQRFSLQLGLKNASDGDELFQFDSGSEAASLAKVCKILEHDIAGCTRRERAAAKTGQRSVQYPYAGPEGRMRVCESGSPRVVKVRDQGAPIHARKQRFAHFRNLDRSGVANRVRNADHLGPRFQAFVR